MNRESAIEGISFFCAQLSYLDAVFFATPDGTSQSQTFEYNNHLQDPIFFNVQEVKGETSECPRLDFRQDSDDAEGICNLQLQYLLDNCECDRSNISHHVLWTDYIDSR